LCNTRKCAISLYIFNIQLAFNEYPKTARVRVCVCMRARVCVCQMVMTYLNVYIPSLYTTFE